MKLVAMVGYDDSKAFLWLFWFEFLVEDMGEMLAETDYCRFMVGW